MPLSPPPPGNAIKKNLYFQSKKYTFHIFHQQKTLFSIKKTFRWRRLAPRAPQATQLPPGGASRTRVVPAERPGAPPVREGRLSSARERLPCERGASHALRAPPERTGEPPVRQGRPRRARAPPCDTGAPARASGVSPERPGRLPRDRGASGAPWGATRATGVPPERPGRLPRDRGVSGEPGRLSCDTGAPAPPVRKGCLWSLLGASRVSGSPTERRGAPPVRQGCLRSARGAPTRQGVPSQP